MSTGLYPLFDISIKFEQSHLFFPELVSWALGVVFLIILVTRTRPLLQAFSDRNRGVLFGRGMDRFRFWGTLALIVVYFIAMNEMGQVWPYTGYGFLFSSIIFIFLLSLLYLHDRTPRHLVIITLNAVIAPLVAWLILARLFNITLP
ncbi:tripartite tricarboxylate transporter TctB family protein [Kushneria phosphatilytica]|uniref:Tripartite tricarboxylate transporter n=1 Tax=Kushneria phosphatilytica TaxID=657387 RepID=A0A1S1P080_9GAMM|nr:tripartite tricarboxylate transporter TctB family protein [Kushneria phosphatilytica]OHV13940.1 tripartite tricarboxylate transporter [Kushneria phosphatilytica]QEL10503.1 tripartite tricarboxylate transporter [Kushneria phosphatilytica]